MLAKKFEEQVAKTPDNAAVKNGENTITYHELNRHANRIAHMINTTLPPKAQKETIGLLFEHGIDMIAAILGTLKAGKTYVPLSPDYPKNRLAYMVIDSRASLILTNTGCEPLAGELARENHILFLNISKIDGSETAVYPGSSANGKKLAYIMYTSGSTGRPKGVIQSHENVWYFIEHWVGKFSITGADRLTLFSSFCHDASIPDVFASLLSGAVLYPLNMKNRDNTEELSEFLTREQITIWHSVPSLFSYFVNSLTGKEKFKHLRFIIFGGEPLRAHEIHMFKKHFSYSMLANIYGMTESTVNSIWLLHPHDSFNKVLIGEPLEGTEIFVVDEDGNEVDSFRVGEIVVHNRHLSHGYWQDEEKTAKVFSNDPDIGRLYWTGDLGRLTLDQNIEFISRKDFQVKIRGFRIEPGEIETQLLKHNKVDETVVIAREDTQGENYLCAYVVLRSSAGEWNTAELREFLAGELPDYMIPSFFVPMDHLPLTRSGKIDRKALPQPEARSGNEYVPPGNEIEKKLAAIWSEVLNIGKYGGSFQAPVGIHDNFFEVGGHSLRATILVSRLHKELNIKINLSQLFQTPTISGLSKYIQRTAVDKYTSIAAVEQREYYGLSSIQKRLYILQQMEPDSVGYNMPTVVELEGKLDMERTRQTFTRLIRRHESLRTFYLLVQEEPVQRVADEVEFEIEYYDLATEITDSTEEKNHNALVQKKGTGRITNYKQIPNYKSQITNKKETRGHHSSFIIHHSFIRPFDLSRAPLVRAGLITTGEVKHILMVDMHHIISDGTSKLVLIREFIKLYGRQELPTLRIQYKDFSHWQKRIFNTEDLKKQEKFWLANFPGEIPVLKLPTDYPRPVVQSFAGNSLGFELGTKETGQLKRLALEEKATVYMMLLTLFNIFLSKISSQEDIVIGTPTAGRRHADLEKIIGVFVNTLALRNYPLAGKTFREFLNDVKERTLQAFENQEYQFEDLVDRVGVKRDASRNPLFDAMLLLQNFEVKEKEDNFEELKMEMNGLTVKPYKIENNTAKFDLSFMAVEAEHNLYFTVEYCTKLFKVETVQRFIGFFQRIVSIVLDNPGKKLFTIEIIPVEEKKRILYDFNDTGMEYPRDKTIHELFEEQVEQNPDHTALLGTHEKHQKKYNYSHISYNQLNEKANQLAYLLTRKNVQPDTIVGIVMERSIEMIIGILAILKAGAAYLPIDPNYPAARIEYILQKSGAVILLSAGNIVDRLSTINFAGEIADISECDSIDFYGRGANPDCKVSSANLAYTIYTSGSTGNPKGVMINHYNVTNFIRGMTAVIEFSRGKAILAATTISFDISVLEILLPLLKGLKIILADENQQRDPLLLEESIVSNRIEMIQMTPSRLKLLLSHPDPRACLSVIETLMLGGEAFPVQIFKSLRSKFKGKLYNLYGPTETTVWSTVKDLTDAQTIDIGKPIANTQILIMTPYNHLQPIDIPGELCIGGAGAARGYLNNPELTAQKFQIPNKSGYHRAYRSYKFYIIYKTGDLARWLPDGNIEFLGRIDHQVKIRGFRIELEEIEEELLHHNRIKEAVVIAREDNEEKYLCAYIITLLPASPANQPPDNDISLKAAELKEYLSRKLPDYMLPTYFIQLKSFPLTPSGKIDRKALPDVEPGSITGTGEQYTPPHDYIEKKLVEIWSEVLFDKKIPQAPLSIGTHDNFFLLGGHSLKATVMMARVHKELDVKVPLAEIFKTPNIRGLSKYIKTAAQDKHIPLEPTEKKEYHDLSSAQHRLYILQQMETGSTAYNMSNVIGLEGKPDGAKLETAFGKLVERHENFRTYFVMKDERPIQRIHDEEVSFGKILNTFGQDLATKDTNKKETRGHHSSFIAHHSFVRPFDLSRAPLLRVGLIELEESRHILMVDMHHIISDGTTLSILIKEFMSFYAGDEPRAMRIQFKDFCQWQNHLLSSGKLKKQQNYWLEKFSREPPLLTLPLDFPRPPVQSFEGDTITSGIGNELYRGLEKLGQSTGTTLFMVLLAAYNILLAKYSGQHDIIVGTTTAGRNHADLEHIVGLLMETLALRNFPADHKTFTDFLQEVKENTLQAFENQAYPFRELMKHAADENDLSRNPLFDTMLMVQNIEITALEIQDIKITPYQLESKVAKLDIMIQAIEGQEDIHFSLQFCTRLFKKETILRLFDHYITIIRQVVENPSVPLGDIQMITGMEKQQILEEFNNTDREIPRTIPVHEAIAIQAEKTPQRIALVCENGMAQLTYRELNQKANHLAFILKEKGVQPDHIVGTTTGPSLEMIIALLGILKSGGAYLPIDPDYPRERITYMLKDSSAKVLITTSTLAKEVKKFRSLEVKKNLEIIFIDSIDFSDSSTSQLLNFSTSQSTSLAYLIYTSGSTGQPKGVMVEHRNLSSYIYSFYREFAISAEDIIIQQASYTFDAFAEEVYPFLLAGAKIAIGKRDEIIDLKRLLTFILRCGVNIIDCSPLLLKELNKQEVAHVIHTFISGADVLKGEHIERLVKIAKVYNTYGPTETTICASYYRCGESVEIKVPIGKPIANYQIYIRDSQNRVLPIGVPGELCITGAGVTRGYLNNPELTAQKFQILNKAGYYKSYRSYKSYILYRTGDLARWLPDGNIEFIGRIDHQVKIRGYRIEPGEIQHCLLLHGDITDAVVLTNDNTDLCAFIVSRKRFNAAQLREFLFSRVPGFMIPAYFVQVDRIPLTPSQKIDRKALIQQNKEALGTGVQYIAPRTGTEKKLESIWQEILGFEKIGIDDSFFQLGGDSLKAMALVSRVHKVFNRQVALVDIFQSPSIRKMAPLAAAGIEKSYHRIELAEEREYYDVSSAQKRLYILDRFENIGTTYHISNVFSIEGKPDPAQLEKAFQLLVNRHDSLRTSFELTKGKPIQRIHLVVDFNIEYYQAKNPEEKIINHFFRRFDLSRAPLLRIGLIKPPHTPAALRGHPSQEGKEDKYLLMLDMHHIISDGVSMLNFIKEFILLYRGEELPPLRVQYKDFSQWQNRQAGSPGIKKQEKFWLESFHGEIPVLRLPLDYARPPVQNYKGDKFNFATDAPETQQLKSLAVEQQTSLFMVLLPVFYVFLSKLAGQEDIVVGVPTAGRKDPDLEPIIGVFINTLALRNYPAAEKTFSQFAAEVRANAVRAFENQDYQFEELVEQAEVRRDTGRNPLFDVMFVIQNNEMSASQMPAVDLPGLRVALYGPPKKSSNFDMILQIFDRGNRIDFLFEYSTDLFQRETIQRFVNYYRTIQSLVLKNPGQKIGQIEIVTNEDKKQLLEVFNGTSLEYPRHKTVPELFAEQVEKTPDYPAVVGGWLKAFDPRKRQIHLTYRELNEKANGLAHLLETKGVKPDTIVGIMVEPSIEMLVGILAIFKSGGAYLPIDPQIPTRRLTSMLKECQVGVLLTEAEFLANHSFTALQDQAMTGTEPTVTAPRQRITNMDSLPLPDRSMIDYNKYNQYIGYAGVKHTISLEATRGCPYNCTYCHKIFPRKQVSRSAENIFAEVLYYYNLGIRRFSIIDDIFNLNIKNSSRFYELIIKNGLNLHLFFSAGLRGDILTESYIDLMVEAGTVNVSPALETASPRLQKLIEKNLDTGKFHRNVRYICKKYPQVITELFVMHGFPSETPEEVRETMDFVKSLEWIHFPYINILRIYSTTKMAKFAREHGISHESIIGSEHLAWHEIPETLPFDKNFTLKIQTEFLDEYFLNKERLLYVLPFQMKLMTEDELVQKYDSYLPMDIDSFSRLLHLAGIKRDELDGARFLAEDRMCVPDLNEKLTNVSSIQEPVPGALKVLLLDLDLYFSKDTNMLYDLVDEPLGLMRLMTQLKQQWGSSINGKIAKSRIDFNDYKELKSVMMEFKPDIIGIRALTFYRDFFHKTVSLIRQWGINVPIIAGGPHVTTNYHAVLQDKNIDLAVLGEGEITLVELIGKILENNGKLPTEDVLEKIAGLAFIPDKRKTTQKYTRDIIMLDAVDEIMTHDPGKIPDYVNLPGNLAYVIFTSGTTGKPKGVLVEHGNAAAYLHAFFREFEIKPADTTVQLASYSFDAFVEEVFPVLLKGGKIVVPSRQEMMDIHTLSHLIVKQQVNIIDCTPLLLNRLNKLEVFDPRVQYTFISGGDVLKEEYVDHLLQWGEVYNTYGPTETTVCATYFRLRGKERSSIPIGAPIANYTTYILDQNHGLQPVGIPGELCVAGPGVTRGYLNKPELTAEKFIEIEVKVKVEENKSYMSHRSYIYHTGDRARWLWDGNIEYLGRIDEQVKIRGYRIEPGEIKSRLIEHSRVKEAAVRLWEDNTGDKYLVAYMVPTDGETFDQTLLNQELKMHLSKTLPNYMIPAFFVWIPAIPLTPGGKLDREKLPAPERGVTGEYTAPRGEIEKKLEMIWSKVLGIATRNLGIHADFFQLGGHSLKAIALTSHIHKKLDVKVPLSELFNRPKLKDLAAFIRESKKEFFEAITPMETKDYYVLSSTQKRLYILNELEGISTAYNLPEVIRIEGKFDGQRFQEAIRALVQRQESLRTSFHLINGEPVQRIHETLDLKIPFSQMKEPGLKKLIEKFIVPFDLSKAPLLRVKLVKLAEDSHVVFFDIHHVISDGSSTAILTREFVSLYEGKDLPALRIRYRDYSEWQNSEGGTGVITAREKYWLRQFDGELPVLNLIADYPRPSIQGFEGANISSRLEGTLCTSVREMVNETGTTLFTVLLTVFNILLYKYTGQEDICIGTPTAGRDSVDLENIIGIFINALTMRNYPRGDKTFKDFLNEVRQNTLTAFENREYPFARLMETINVKIDISRNPLFDVELVVQNMEEAVIDLKGVRVYSQQYEQKTSQVDIALYVFESGTGIFFDLIYCTKLYKRETMERFITHFIHILEQVVPHTHSRLSRLEIISEGEKQQILECFNNTRTEFATAGTFHELFAEQLERTPDHIAVVAPLQMKYRTYMTYMTYITYRELNEKSDRLAYYLKEKGVKPDTIAAIMVERSVEMIIAILGILKAGGAYLPIDPGYPQERINYMLQDSSAKVLITTSTLAKEVKKLRSLEVKKNLEIISIDSIDFSDSSSSQLLNFSTSQSTSLAYVIYTSGSTGRPRGVMVEHRQFLNSAFAWRREYRLGHMDINLLQMASFSFDVFAGDLARSLINGGTLVICPEDVKLDFESLYSLVRKYRITLFESTPGLIVPFMKYVNENQLPIENLQLLIIGSDTCRAADFKTIVSIFSSRMRVINSYGVTEATIDSSYYEETLEHLPEAGDLSIGKPMPNMTLYILDEGLNLQPVGALGELFIGGKSISRGYLNNPGLTNKKFLPGGPGGTVFSKRVPPGRRRLYKTGDLARWMMDGNIQFLGRKDSQVKIRGYRIELGEIENTLVRDSSIKEVVVIDRADSQGSRYLCAYIAEDDGFDAAGVREFLLTQLPNYMVPTHFVPLDRIPLTVNGKIDRKALPVPQFEAEPGYVKPRDRVEEKLVSIWSNILEVDKEVPGIDTNFFNLGGHSLKAMAMLSKIYKEFNIKVPLTEIFKTPTIRNLSKFIKTAEEDKYLAVEPVEKKEYYTLSPPQKRLFFQWQIGEGESIAYNIPQVIELKTKLDKERLGGTFQQLIQHHESLRTSFEIIDNEPVQRIHQGTGGLVPLPIELEASTIKNFIQPFDLSRVPLFRVGLLEDRQKCILMVDMHHIISDGISLDILLEDFKTLYGGELLPPPRVQYKDYAHWRNRQFHKERDRLTRMETYWVNQLEGEVPVLNLPTDYPRPELRSIEGGSVNFEIGKESTAALKNLALKNNATVFMILLALFNVLLSKLGGGEDIIVGTPTAGRKHPDSQRIIGMFANALALRNYPKGKKTFLQFLADLRKRSVEAFENEDYPFEELLEKIKLERDASRTPLFDAMFAFYSHDGQLDYTKAEKQENHRETISKYDMTLSALETRHRLLFTLDYCTRLFKPQTIDTFIRYFKKILVDVPEDPDRPIADIEIISEKEQTELLEKIWDKKGKSFTGDKKTSQDLPGIEAEFDF